MTKRTLRIILVVVVVFLVIVFCGSSVYAWPQFRSSLIGPQGPAGAAGPAGESVIGPMGPAGPQGPAAPTLDPAVQPTVNTGSENTAPVPEPVGAVVTALQNTQDMGQWMISYYTGATQLMKDFVFTDFLPGWKEFPNVDWPAGNFKAANGLEYGQELSDFCQQDVTCDFPVAARSFRTITADYNISGIGKCAEAGTGIGCAVIIVNVGDVTASYRNQMVDTGHTITGLYWNGEELDQAISAWASHIVYRMVGIPASNPANPGANCSVPTGCKGVNLTFAVTSGNELLVLGTAVVKP